MLRPAAAAARAGGVPWTLRGRWTPLLGAFLAVCGGVGVVALTALLYASGSAQVPDEFRAAAVVVQSPAVRDAASTFPETRPWSAEATAALADRLAGVPGVIAAVSDRRLYAQVVLAGRPVAGQLAAHGWSSNRLGARRLVAGTPPVAQRDVVLDRALGLAPGAPVTVLTATGPAEYTVAGLLDGPGIFLADDAAAGLAPGVRAIGLLVRPGAEAAVAARARAVVGAEGEVLTGAARGALEPRADVRTRWIGSQVLAAMAALAAFVSIFVVASTFTFVANQRRRELGLLRLVGATPRQVRRLLYREAAVVGGLGSAAGVALGTLLALALEPVLVKAGFEPASYRVRLQLWPVAVAFAVGPVVALSGMWAAARRAAKVRPLEALRTAEVETRPMTRARWLAGVAFAAAGAAAGVATAATTDTRGMATYSLLGTMALVVAGTLLAPAVVPFAVRVLTWPLLPLRGATALLVRESALTAVRRTASTATPVLLTVAFAVLITGNVQTTTRAYESGRAATVRAGSVIVPDATPGLSDAAVAAAPGAALLETAVYVADTVEPAIGVEPSAFASANRRLAVLSGTLGDLTGGDTVVVTRSAAERYGWRPGAVATVTFADGAAVPLRVVAVVSDGSSPAGLMLPRTVVRSHDPSALTSAVLLAGPPPARVPVGARAVPVATYAAERDAEEDRLVWIFTLLLVGVSAGYGAMAVANTLVMAAAHRVADFQVLRLAGATGWQVSAAVAVESTLIVAIGSVLGGLVAFLALQGGLAALSEQVGAPVDVVVPWTTIGAVVLTCLVLAVTASVVPARLALRRSR